MSTTSLPSHSDSRLRNRNAKTWAPVNLDRIQHWVEQGRLTSTPETPITARELYLSGCVHDVHNGIKLLGDVSFVALYICSMDSISQIGRGPVEDTNSHYTITSFQDRHSCCGKARRDCLLQVLQPPRIERLRRRKDR